MSYCPGMAALQLSRTLFTLGTLRDQEGWQKPLSTGANSQGAAQGAYAITSLYTEGRDISFL